jgi:hypothetical protein
MSESAIGDAESSHVYRGPSRRGVLAGGAAAVALAAIPSVAARAVTVVRAATGSRQTPLWCRA